MKLFSAIVLAASLVPYLKANTCESPLVGGGLLVHDMPPCYAFKRGKFELAKCTSKAVMKLQIKDSGKMCNKLRCLSYKEKKGKVIIKMRKRGTHITFEQVADRNYLVATSPNELKGQFPRFADGEILFNADGKFGQISCSVLTTPEPPTPVPTTPVPTTIKTKDYTFHSGGCMPMSDRWPTVKHPKSVKRRQTYDGGFFEDFYAVADQSVTSCKVLCDKESWCIGFEYFPSPRPDSIKFKAFEAGDCQLNYNDPKHEFRPKCEGWGVDYYEKMDEVTTTPVPTTTVPTTTTIKTKDYTFHSGACMPMSDRWPTVKHPKSVKRRQTYDGGFFEEFFAVADQSVTSCKVLCDKESWCIGFEYFPSPRPDSIKFKAFEAGDCQLNYNDPKHEFRPKCEGWGVDYYEKMDEVTTTPVPTTTTIKTKDYTFHSGACMPMSDRWPTVKHPKSVKRRQVYDGGFFEEFYAVADQSVTSCKVLCDKESWCIGFEYFPSPRPDSIKFKAFEAGDCTLNYNDPKHQFRPKCEGWGVDYYELKD